MPDHICVAVWDSGRPWCDAWGGPNPFHGCALGSGHHERIHRCKCGSTCDDRSTAPPPRVTKG